MSTVETPTAPPTGHVATTRWGRLYWGQTAVDFWGRRYIGFAISGALILLTVLSLFTRGLDLGIDFEGGIVLDVPAGDLTIDGARDVLEGLGLNGEEADVQRRSSDSGDIIKVQVSDQPDAVREELQQAFADEVGVDTADVSVSSVSSTWGREITEKALRALLIFLALVSVFLSIRFEWRMAAAAIVAMVHDVVVSVGIYSLFGFEVSPETVIAFLTILGYSLYDTIVVFDRIKENERRLSGLGPIDQMNVSVNQVLLRSLNTSLATIMPVLSLLIIGAGVLGAVTLREFALALLVGIITGAYSSLFIASPVLAMFKDRAWRKAGGRRATGGHLVGEELRALVIAGSMSGVPASSRSARRRAMTASPTDPDDPAAGPEPTSPAAGPPGAAASTAPDVLLSHPPRPRKKKRR